MAIGSLTSGQLPGAAREPVRLRPARGDLRTAQRQNAGSRASDIRRTVPAARPDRRAELRADRARGRWSAEGPCVLSGGAVVRAAPCLRYARRRFVARA